MRTIIPITLFVSLFALGCDKPAEQPPTEPPPSAEAPAETPPVVEAPAEVGAKVELAAAGQKFDPAIQPEQLPDAAWYCDMGTVHWAASDKPADGKCPECAMVLKEYSAAGLAQQKEQAVEEKPHAEDGHEHADGEEDHEH